MMLKIYFKMLIVIINLFAVNTYGVEKPFVIVIPSHNNKQWFKHNLDSVLYQKYKNYRVIYIDDASSDNTGILVEQYIKTKAEKNRFTIIKNKERRYAMANRYFAIHSCRPSEIIINLDGDDWFATDDVLTYLNKIYQDKNVWMTYGQYVRFPQNTVGHGKAVPKEIISTNKFRKFGFIPTALYSFYAELFHKIDKKDLMYQNNFLQMAHSAYMYPVIEMAGFHSRFISQIFYVYNQANGINDNKVNFNLQRYLSSLIRLKHPYEPLSSLSSRTYNKLGEEA